MMRFARVMPVFFFEEPAFEAESSSYLAEYPIAENLTVLVPHLPVGMDYAAAAPELNRLLSAFLRRLGGVAPVWWFYTPAAIAFADAAPAALTVYDCMDELSGFQDASPELSRREAELLRRADLVFTGGMSLYEAKRTRHRNVHLLPSAVDAAHFARARNPLPEPADQAEIPHPRLGFFGVIDERLDRDLVAAVARMRPDWQLVFVGPVVKIAPETLPQAPNIHYLGRKAYDELPGYVAHWDAAIMPFARNSATRFISPTKTPEYLAAGKPVISTPIADVMRAWGHLEAVRIADGAAQFVADGSLALSLPARHAGWLEPVDRAVAQLSWDRTWAHMAALIETALAGDRAAPPPVSTDRAPSFQPALGATGV